MQRINDNDVIILKLLLKNIKIAFGCKEMIL